jgi:hypothetical protein
MVIAGLAIALSMRRRAALLEFAQTRGAVVIEDDYDAEFRIGGRPLDAPPEHAGVSDGVEAAPSPRPDPKLPPVGPRDIHNIKRSDMKTPFQRAAE